MENNMKFLVLVSFGICCIIIRFIIKSIVNKKTNRKIIIDRDNRTFHVDYNISFDKGKNVHDAVDWAWENLWDNSFENDPKIKILNADECYKRFSFFKNEFYGFVNKYSPSIGFHIRYKERKHWRYRYPLHGIFLNPRIHSWDADEAVCREINYMEDEYGSDGGKYTIVGVWYEFVVECVDREYIDIWMKKKFGKHYKNKNTPTNVYINCCGNKKRSSWGI